MQLRGVFLSPLAFAALATAAPPLSEVLKANNDTLSTLNALLQMVPAVAQTLSRTKDLTILAPSNQAFAKLSQMDPDFSRKLTNATFVSDLLLYHAVTGKTTSAMFSAASPRFAATLYNIPMSNITGSQKVELSRKNLSGGSGSESGDHPVVFSGFKQMSTVVRPDINFAVGGVLHVVDAVLTLPGSPAETAMNTGLTAMAGALARAALADDVDALHATTILAPTNEAFRAVGETVASMAPAELAKVMQYHVLTNQIRFTTGVPTRMKFKSLMGGKVTLQKENGVLFANSARVVVSDIITNDGVMHVVDNALNPDAPKLTPNPSAATSSLAFAGARAAAVAPFTEDVRPTANFVLASLSSRTLQASYPPLVPALLGFLGCVTAVLL